LVNSSVDLCVALMFTCPNAEKDSVTSGFFVDTYSGTSIESTLPSPSKSKP
jgi:hypothetical protein